MRHYLKVVCLVLTACLASAQEYTVRTFAGGGLPVNVRPTAALLMRTHGVAVDSVGDLYISLQARHIVVRVPAGGGNVTLFAGSGKSGYSGDGNAATAAQLSFPAGLAFDSTGNLYIADTGNHCVRRVGRDGKIATVAGVGISGFSGDGGPAASAQLDSPQGVAVGPGDSLYIADTRNQRIRRIAGGTISTFAGTGVQGFNGDDQPPTAARLWTPTGVAVDAAGAVYIADSVNNRIRKATAATITTVAGDGGTEALRTPSGVALDGRGCFYVADLENHRIQKVCGATVTTVAGTGKPGFNGDGATATTFLRSPVAVAFAGETLYISDSENHRVRRLLNSTIQTVAGTRDDPTPNGDGPVTAARFNNTKGIALDSQGNVFVTDVGSHRVRKIALGAVLTMAGTGTTVPGTDAPDCAGDGKQALAAMLGNPEGIELDLSGNLIVPDWGCDRVWKITSDGKLSIFAGTGIFGFSGDGGLATKAQLAAPEDIAVDSAGNVYIADRRNHRIRMVAPNGMISTVAGSGPAPRTSGGYSGDGGKATEALLNQPQSISVDSARNLYIADTENHRIRKVTAAGIITTVAGNGFNGFNGEEGTATGLSLAFPAGVAVDSANNVYIADTANLRIRKLSGTTMRTIGGGGTNSAENLPARDAHLPAPTTLDVDSAGKVYFTNVDNRVRVLEPVIINCTPLVEPSPIIVGPEGGIVPVTVTVNPSCGQWTATSNQPWAKVESGSPSTGPAKLQLSVLRNTTRDKRPATLTISGPAVLPKPVPLTQEGALCGAVFTSQSLSFPAAGGSPLVPFTLPAGCGDQPRSSAPDWLNCTITGAGTLTCTAQQNTSSAGRTAQITFATATLPVTQAGAACTFTVAPLSRTVAPTQNSGAIQIVSPAGCAWPNAASSETWLHIQAPGSPFGTGELLYTVDANTGASQRTGNISFSGSVFRITQNAAAVSTTCTVGASPVTLRRQGITERVADVTLNCSGVPPAGVTTDLQLTLTSTVTSRLLDESITSLTEAVAILNSAPSPVLGTSAWQAALSGPNVLRWKNVRITPSGSGQAKLRLTNIRVNASSGPASVRALLDLRSAAGIALANASLEVATAQNAVTVSSGDPLADTGANQTIVPLIFREQTPGAFRILSDEGGQFPASAQATTATRLRVRLLQVPAAARVFAPVWSDDGISARLITGADGNGNGGTEQSGTEPVLLARDNNGAVTAIWEVKSATTDLDTLTFPMMIVGATTAELDGLIANRVAGLAPVSTDVSAVFGAAVPRFGDPIASIARVNLSILSTGVHTAAAASAKATNIKFQTIAPSVIAGYDISNDSSEVARDITIRSSSPAGYTFTRDGTDPAGGEISYSTDMTEAKIRYASFDPREKKRISLGLTGAPESGNYADFVTTVDGRGVDLDLNDNLATVAIAGNCALIPPSARFHSGGGNRQFSIGSPCGSWAVVSKVDWVVINSPSGSGPSTVSYTVKPNPGAERFTTIDAAGQPFTIVQDGNVTAGCSYDLSSSFASVEATGTVSSFALTTGGGCRWQGYSSNSWLQVFPIAGTGTNTLAYTVFPNFTPAPRQATITAGGKTFTISQGANAKNADERFVQLIYFSFFGRPPSDDELKLQVNQGLGTAKDYAGLVMGFLNSLEFNLGGRFVAGLYVGLLDRNAEFGGWQFQRDAKGRGDIAPQALVNNFLSSGEYTLRFGNPDNQEFVRLLYRYILRREATPQEVNNQSGRLQPQGSMTRADMAFNFLNSDEFRQKLDARLTAFLLYSTLLLRDATPDEMALRMGQLANATPAIVKQIVAEIIRSPEFKLVVGW